MDITESMLQARLNPGDSVSPWIRTCKCAIELPQSQLLSNVPGTSLPPWGFTEIPFFAHISYIDRD